MPWAGSTCIHAGQREFSQSVSCYEKCLRQRPDDPNILFKLGAVFYDMNHIEMAVDLWKKFIEKSGEVCHFIDFASFVIGADPVEVQAMCVDSTNAALKAEDNVSISVKYRDGSVAQICYVAVGPSDLAKEYCEVFADESAAVGVRPALL